MAEKVITLSNADISEAVTDWMIKNEGITVSIQQVYIGVFSETVGYGMGERRENRVNISVSISA